MWLKAVKIFCDISNNCRIKGFLSCTALYLILGCFGHDPDGPGQEETGAGQSEWRSDSLTSVAHQNQSDYLKRHLENGTELFLGLKSKEEGQLRGCHGQKKKERAAAREQ